MSPDAPEMEIPRRGRWFASLPPALQARIAERGMLRRFRTGQYLVREGDPPRGLFGSVQRRTRHVCAVGEDREVLMHVGGPGASPPPAAPMPMPRRCRATNGCMRG
jgi:hypothetical protein